MDSAVPGGAGFDRGACAIRLRYRAAVGDFGQHPIGLRKTGMAVERYRPHAGGLECRSATSISVTVRNFKLHWKKPLFYVCLPVLLVMVFLGFPLPVPPPPETKPRQKHSVPAKDQSRHPGARFGLRRPSGDQS